MADQTYELGVNIGWTSDDAKLKDVVAQLDKLNSQMTQFTQNQQQATSATREHGEALSGLGGKVAGLVAQFVGLAATIRFTWDAFKEAVTADKLMTQLVANARMLGNATEEQVKHLDPWIAGIQRAGGLMKGELIPAVTTLMAATHNLNAAEMLTEIASGAAARGIGDFEGNIATLARAMETGTLRGFSPFTQLIREMMKGPGGVEDLNKALPELVKKFGDAGAAVDTVAMRLRRNQVAWHDSKEEMGRALEAVSSGAMPLLKVLSFGLAMVGGGVMKLIGAFKVMHDVMHGDLASAKLDWQEWSEKATKLIENVADAWQKPVEAAQRSAKDQKDAEDAALATFRAALEAKLKAQKDNDQKLLEELERHNAQVRNREMQLQLEAQLRANAEVKIEADMLQRMEALWRRYEANEAAIRDISRTNFAKLNARELAMLQEHLRQMLREHTTSMDERNKVTLIMAQINAQIQERAEMEATAGMLGALSNAFPEFKAFGLAKALINTYEGVTEALTLPWPMNLIAAATTLAEGLAQVRQIESVNPHGGGGGGGSIAAAPTVTVPPTVYAGPTAPAAAAAPSVSSTVNQPQNITINTLTGDGAVATARAVQRILRPGSRAYDRGVVNRQALTIGSTRR